MRLKPTLAEALNILGRIQRRQADWSGMADTYGKLSKVQEKIPSVHYHRGVRHVIILAYVFCVPSRLLTVLAGAVVSMSMLQCEYAGVSYFVM